MANIKVFVLCIIAFFGHAQYNDTLEQLLAATIEDSTKINVIIRILDITDEDEKWQLNVKLLIKLSEQLSSSSNAALSIKGKKGLAEAYLFLGYFYSSKSNLKLTLENHSKSMKLREELGDFRGILKSFDNIIYLHQLLGNSGGIIYYSLKTLPLYRQLKDEQAISFAYSNIGLAYQKEGNVPQALYYHDLSLKINEKLKNLAGMAQAYNNIGFVYDEQNDKQKALSYYKKSLEIFEKAGDKKSTAVILGNIGLIYYSSLNDPAKALAYLSKSLNLNEEIKERKGIAYSLNNLGTLYRSLNKTDTALMFYLRSLELSRLIGDRIGITNVSANIGDIYLKKNQLSLAYKYSDSALSVAKIMGYPFAIRKAERSMASIDSAAGNYLGAYKHYNQYIFYRDSLNNENTRKASIKSQLKYEFEKKEAVINEQQEKERMLARDKNNFQQIIIGSVITGLLLVIVFAIFVFRTLTFTRRQKIIIEQKQKEILDSIHYAKRIQQSLLPSEKYFEKYFGK